MSTPRAGHEATTEATPTRVIRQRGSMWAAGFLVVVLVVLVALDIAAGRDVTLDGLGWLLLCVALLWALFVRPAVVVSRRGILLRNLIRDADIPWERVEDFDTRWNLAVKTRGAGTYTSWAIGSRRRRPGWIQRLIEPLPLIGGPQSLSPSAQVVKLHEDYLAAVKAKRLERSDGPVVVSWALGPIFAVLAALALALLLSNLHSFG